MMPSGFFALLDDLALIMDDVAAMTKVAGKKTAGILGDDLAVNAEKAIGFPASRELPVLLAITKGSFLNKLIILPLAFLLSAFAGWLIQPILIAGGVYLAYEGVEKVLHMIRPHHEDGHSASERPDEKARIRSAVLVDFILSVEIIILALSQVVESELIVQVLVVSIISLVATVGVYGLVALIVRMDNAGYALAERDTKWVQNLGMGMVRALPILIRIISHVGTLALLLVAGGIFHHIDVVHHVFHGWPGLVVDGLLGLIVGGLAVLGAAGIRQLMAGRR
jgi:predicted DNA repair protein MutK